MATTEAIGKVEATGTAGVVGAGMAAAGVAAGDGTGVAVGTAGAVEAIGTVVEDALPARKAKK